MLITLTGANDFMLGAELQRLVGDFVAEYSDLALERLDCETAEYDQIRGALQSLPFLSARKLVVLRSSSLNKQFSENASKLIAEIPESTDVIIVDPKIDKRSSYYKLLKTKTDFREFIPLDIGGVSLWLTRQAAQQGASLSTTDARFLAERVGLNQQLLSNELEKLIIYSPNISRDSIELLTEPSPQSKIFDLLDAAFVGDIKRTMFLYKDQRAQKVDPLQIISMLTWQLQVFALMKAAGDRSVQTISSETKLNPYVVQKSLVNSRRLSRAKLKKLVHDLLVIDKRAKTENIDVDEALQNYLIGLSDNQ